VIFDYSGQNLGLVGGRNRGQSLSNGELLLFLDSDTTIDRRMISCLASFAEDSRIGIIVPKMFSYLEPKRLWFAGATFNILTSRANNVGAWEIDTGKYEVPTLVSHGPTCFMVKKTLADSIGGHDPLFFQSYADTDFGFRIKKLGYVNIYCPQAVLYHKTPTVERNNSLRGLGMDQPLRAYYYARNKTIFMKKHSSRTNFMAYLFVLLPTLTVMYLHRIALYGGGRVYLSQYVRGLIDGLQFAIRRL
jgi:GT2 family glycosyltransferase